MDSSSGLRKVLIITYYWPPSGGAGVQRWLKFSKYLHEFGWDPIIYTPENPEAPAQDFSLLHEIPRGIEVIKTPIWEPYEFYKKLVGMKKGEKVNAGFLNEKKKPGLAEGFSTWIRGNFFIPDARKFWIKPSVKFLVKYLKNNPVDAIVSTGPPHSMHLIALGVKNKCDIPWLADFRDPWTQIDFYHQLHLSSIADNKHKRLEKAVLKTADSVVTVSKNWSKDLAALYPRKIEVVTNGFDAADFNTHSVDLDTRFTLTHVGSLNKDRNPNFLWATLKEICSENEFFNTDLELKFIGKTDIAVFDQLEKKGLIEKATKVDYMPHKEVIAEASRSQVLMLLINNTPNMAGIIPGKIFEYLASNRPVLCIAPPDGDSANIIKESGAGYVVDFGDSETLKKVILELYSKYKQGNLLINTGSISQFSRRSLTGSIAELLNSITQEKI
ncbi:MAG: glycosyltransferase family 4 protein [Bacteroidota bacterium]